MVENVSAVILAGGSSRRMKQNKALLKPDGKTFLEHIAGELSGFGELLLSVRGSGCPEYAGFTLVPDRFENGGPLAGIYSALCACRSPYLFVCSCDIPFFQYRLAEYLLSFLSGEYDVIVPVTSDQRLQPLCAVYSKTVLPVLKKALDRGLLKLQSALSEAKVRTVPLSDAGFSDDILMNINTPEQYEAVFHQKP